MSLWDTINHEKTPEFQPRIPCFFLPLAGGGQGGGDHDMKFNEILFFSPSPPPSPAWGEGVSGGYLIKVFSEQRAQRNYKILLHLENRTFLLSVPSVVSYQGITLRICGSLRMA